MFERFLKILTKHPPSCRLNFVHPDETPPFCFWRDATDHEIDLLVDRGTHQIAIEIKSTKTIASDFFDNLIYWRKLTGNPDAPSALIYGGAQATLRRRIMVLPRAIL